MHLYYFSPYDILRPRTNQISDIRFCESFVELGCKVELIVPYVYRKDNLDKNKVLKFYDVSKPFEVKYLNTNFTDDISGKRKLLTIIRKNFKFFRKIIRQTNNENVIIFSRSVSILYPFLLYLKYYKKKKNILVVPWLHEIKKGRLTAWVCKNSKCIITTNSSIAQDLSLIYGVPKKNIFLTLNPISENQLKNKIDKTTARKRINYKEDKTLIVYTGKLFIGQKEAEYIIDSARELPQCNFLFTGGKPNVITYYQKFCEEHKLFNCIFTGYIHNYSLIKNYQAAADILISFYTPDLHDLRYNLPQKLCEYMLTRNPIVTNYFPALQDLLNDDNAFLIKDNNPKSITKKIKYVLDNPAEAKKVGDKAFDDVKKITYKNISEKNLQFLNNFFNE